MADKGVETLPAAIMPEAISWPKKINPGVEFLIQLKGFVSNCYVYDYVKSQVDEESRTIYITLWWKRVINEDPCTKNTISSLPNLVTYVVPVGLYLRQRTVYRVYLNGVTFPDYENNLLSRGYNLPVQMSDYYDKYSKPGSLKISELDLMSKN